LALAAQSILRTIEGAVGAVATQQDSWGHTGIQGTVPLIQVWTPRTWAYGADPGAGHARLLAAQGTPISAEQLLEEVWDEATDPFTTTVKRL